MCRIAGKVYPNRRSSTCSRNFIDFPTQGRVALDWAFPSLRALWKPMVGRLTSPTGLKAVRCSVSRYQQKFPNCKCKHMNKPTVLIIDDEPQIRKLLEIN